MGRWVGADPLTRQPQENTMCRAVKCRSCGKTTWAGCGNHVQDVMRHIPKSERCTCDRTAATGNGGGWFARLLGK